MKIFARQGFTGDRAGVKFVNGVGETDIPHLIEWFKLKGYKVEETPVEVTGETSPKPIKRQSNGKPKTKRKTK